MTVKAFQDCGKFKTFGEVLDFANKWLGLYSCKNLSLQYNLTHVWGTFPAVSPGECMSRTYGRAFPGQVFRGFLAPGPSLKRIGLFLTCDGMLMQTPKV
jgi:hypothetical protein